MSGYWYPKSFMDSGFSPPSVFDSRQLSGYVADFDTRYNVTDDGSGKASAFGERWGNGMSFSQATSGSRPTITQNALGTAPALTGNGTSTFMSGNTAAKSLVRNTSAYTVYVLARVNHNTTNGYLFSCSTNASATVTRALIGSGNSAAQMYAGGRIGDTGSAGVVIGPRAGLSGFYPWTSVVDHSVATGWHYRNNIMIARNTSLLTVGSIPDTASNSATLMSQPDGTASWFNGDLLRLIICKGNHTEAQRATAWQGIFSEYNTLHPIKNGTPALIVQVAGDSIMQGNILPARTPDFTYRLWQQLGSSNGKLVVNTGRSGAKTTDVNTDRPSYIDILPLSEAGQMVYVIYVGINDMVAGTTGATAYNNIKTGVTAAKAARPGLKVIVCTPIGSSTITAPQRAELVNLRNAIIANAVADGATAVCDMGARAELSTSSTSAGANTTYYVDGLHPTDVGQILMATDLASTITSIT